MIVPPRPGVLSTWGLLDTDIRATFVRTVGPDDRRATGDAAAPRLEAAWRELEAQARAWLDAEEVPREGQRFERAADLRYEHQSFELTCPRRGTGHATAAMLAALIATFHAEHRRLYTYDLPRAPIELVNLRVTAIGALPRRSEAGAGGGATPRDAKIGERRVYFRGAGWLVTPCYARAALTPGMRFAGPAVIEQDDATPLVAPGFEARVDQAGNLILQRGTHA